MQQLGYRCCYFNGIAGLCQEEHATYDGKKAIGKSVVDMDVKLFKNSRLAILENFLEAEIRKSSDAVRIRGLSVARQAGIEPTTPWFVARYSIQLSYCRAIS